jgi:hypothetical protein
MSESDCPGVSNVDTRDEFSSGLLNGQRPMATLNFERSEVLPASPSGDALGECVGRNPDRAVAYFPALSTICSESTKERSVPDSQCS